MFTYNYDNCLFNTYFVFRIHFKFIREKRKTLLQQYRAYVRTIYIHMYGLQVWIYKIQIRNEQPNQLQLECNNLFRLLLHKFHEQNL